MAVFLAALGAQLIGVEKIVGAFLAGLAVNDAVGEGAVKEKVIFVGSVLFIPIFFVDMGLLIDLPAFIESISSFWLTIAIVVGLISSKFFAALFAALAYRYKRREMLAMWSLSLPQVAATLAATLVGVQEKILTPAVLNSVIVLMIVTSILGPLITSRVAPGLEVPERNLIPESPTSEPETAPRREFTVIVPVYNPRTEKHLIEMAALLARHEAGRIVPLSVVKAQAHMDAAEIDEAFARSDRLLEIATKVSQKLAVAAEPLVRIDDDFAQAISYASREQKASLIVMGWGNRTGLRARLFGNVIDSVLWTSHCPVAVTRLLESPLKIQRILVPLENLSSEQVSPVRFAKILAETNQAQVTLMQVCDRRTSAAQIEAASSQLSTLAANWMPAGNFNVQIIPHDDVVRAIAQAAPNFDLAIWRFRRQRTAAGLAVGDITNQLVQQLTCSVVLLGEPQRIEGK